MAKVTRSAAKGTHAPPSIESTDRRPSEDADLVKEFRKLGFTEYEARAYLTLCQTSPATAYEVSKIAGLGKANIYSALEGLAERGAVQPVSESPVKYVPVEPSRLLGQIEASTSARCKEIMGKLERMPRAQSAEYVWTVREDKNIHARIGEMIDRARKHIWIKGPHDLLEGHIPALRRAAKRGVKTLIVLFGDKERLGNFAFGRKSRAYLHEGSGVLIGPAHKLITVTIDYEEALTANTGESAHGAFTRSAPVVQLAEQLLRHEVYLAEIFLQFGPQIEQVFGPSLLKLREKYLPTHDMRILKSSLETP